MGGPTVPWQPGRTDYDSAAAAEEHRGVVGDRCDLICDFRRVLPEETGNTDYRMERKVRTMSETCLPVWAFRIR